MQIFHASLPARTNNDILEARSKSNSETHFNVISLSVSLKTTNSIQVVMKIETGSAPVGSEHKQAARYAHIRFLFHWQNWMTKNKFSRASSLGSTRMDKYTHKQNSTTNQYFLHNIFKIYTTIHPNSRTMNTMIYSKISTK